MNAIRIEERPCVIGLPTHHYVEYFGVMPDGTQFIIHRPRDDWKYTDFQCLLKPEKQGGFLSVRVVKVTRYRDGGTTDIELDHGAFHFPSPFTHDEPDTFDGQPITVFERVSS